MWLIESEIATYLNIWLINAFDWTLKLKLLREIAEHFKHTRYYTLVYLHLDCIWAWLLLTPMPNQHFNPYSALQA